MSRRKLGKKDFEVYLNAKGDTLAMAGVDLTGMDDYFESWKEHKRDVVLQTGGEGVVFPGYGTWLRKNKINEVAIVPEFDRRYHNWVQTHA